MQLKAARDLYLPAKDTITIQVGDTTITGLVSDFVKSEAGLAMLMDRKVNTGKLDPLPAVLAQIAAEVKPQTLADLAPYERDIIAAVKYRKDYLADNSLTQPPTSRGTRWATQASRGGKTSRGNKR
jgi:hypothetical protein